MSLGFAGFGLSETVSEALGYGTVVGLITYLSLVLVEVVPKQIALRNPERIACFVAPAMTLLAKVAAPILLCLNWLGKLVPRALCKGVLLQPDGYRCRNPFADCRSRVARRYLAGGKDNDCRRDEAGRPSGKVRA